MNNTTRSPEIQNRVRARMQVRDEGYTSPCWVSNRAPCGKGYTKMYARGRLDMTHRVSYEAFVGAIPSGMVIDHLCRVRACCNPLHLEPVTTRENLMRGETVTASEVAQTACHKGHPFTADNTYMRPDRYGRACRACRDESTKRRRASRRRTQGSSNRQDRL